MAANEMQQSYLAQDQELQEQIDALYRKRQAIRDKFEKELKQGYPEGARVLVSGKIVRVDRDDMEGDYFVQVEFDGAQRGSVLTWVKPAAIVRKDE